MHVFGVFPCISCVFFIVDQKGLVVFVCPLSAGEELGGLCAFCVGGALEGGEVLTKGLVGTCDCGDRGIKRDDTRGGEKLEGLGVGVLALCCLGNLLNRSEARWVDRDKMEACQAGVIL